MSNPRPDDIKIANDLLLHGKAITKDGKHVELYDVYRPDEPLADQAEPELKNKGPTPEEVEANKQVKMTVRREYPPNYEHICSVFPWVRDRRGILFAWDDRICNPDGIEVTPALHAHEQVHSIQQFKVGGPELWWANYLNSADFRFDQEVKAHIVEYANIYEHFPRNKRRLYLKDIAARLAGPLYGGLTSQAVAERLLKTGASVLLDPTRIRSITMTHPQPKEA